MLTLFEEPWSHWCVKVRKIMDYKKIKYKVNPVGARRPELKTQMENHLQILEEMLTEHRFLLDEKPSLADFAAFGAISPLPYSGNKLPDKLKKLTSWHDTMNRL